ncbi:hypothetical protein Tco_0386250, partial [Tanacetum coccineum]
SEVLDQTFDRLQKLISQLEIHDESIFQEWNTYTIVWRNKPEIDTLSLDDLYNNMKIYEPEVKGTSSSSTNTQNIVFVSLNSTSSTNGAVNIAHDVTTTSTQATIVNSTTIDNLSDVVICAFFVVDGYANNESKEILEEHCFVYEEDIKVLKREIPLREVAITELDQEVTLAQKQKDEIRLPVENFENSSKNLSKLIDCQIVDKCKIGLRYNAVPPPYIGNFMPPKPDLSFSGLEKFTSESIFINPIVEKSEAKASKAKPKAVRKNNGAPIIEDWVSDSEEENVSQTKIEKKIVKPSFAKIEFVKSKKQVKSPRKTTDKQVETTKIDKTVGENSLYVTTLQNYPSLSSPHTRGLRIGQLLYF